MKTHRQQTFHTGRVPRPDYAPAITAGVLENIKQITGCCSSLSATTGTDTADELHTACFDCCDGYTGHYHHNAISTADILKLLQDYHGMCASDENLESLAQNLASTESSLTMITRYN